MASGNARLVSSLSWVCRPTAGSRERGAAIARRAWVRAPTAVTMAVAVPATTVEVACSMQVRSPTGVAGVASVCLGTGSDSPVSDDSSTSTSAAWMSRASAGTTSPGRTSMTSPGRSARAGTVCAPPSGIRTRAGASCTANRRCNNRSARMRCVAAKAALPVNTEPTSAASTGEPSTALAADPTARTGVNGSDNSSRMARAKSATARLTAAPAALAVPDAAVASRERGTVAVCGAGGGRAARTSSTDIACHSAASVAGGGDADSAVRASR